MKALASEHNINSMLSKFVKTHYSPLICITKISVRSSEQTLCGYCENVGFCQIALSTRHGDNTCWQATGVDTEQVWPSFFPRLLIHLKLPTNPIVQNPTNLET